MNQEEFITLVCKRVQEKLDQIENYKIPIGVSNRHVHLCKKDLETLFGEGYELTKKSDLKQPGQFASNELVTIRGSKGEFENVRILGPIRNKTQVEISLTDSFRLGVKAPIKESGKLEGTPGLEIIGPKGKINVDEGTIVALRHIHMTPKEARLMNVKDGDFVDVEIFGQRRAIMSKVLVRVSDSYRLEMHLDTDEANSVSIKNGDFAILKNKNSIVQ
ncbi:MAG: phosphate propanoyltransferase [Peptoanaerobacter stomatis]|uniref:phosphate propanoyltransferase n=1 Tax=Peptoanaerobacter stomatis TaxID=796937 RepID=UPI003F9FC5B6